MVLTAGTPNAHLPADRRLSAWVSPTASEASACGPPGIRVSHKTMGTTGAPHGSTATQQVERAVLSTKPRHWRSTPAASEAEKATLTTCPPRAYSTGNARRLMRVTMPSARSPFRRPRRTSSSDSWPWTRTTPLGSTSSISGKQHATE
eukprot:5234316-Pleurochrysis_carterae.AAC.8